MELLNAFSNLVIPIILVLIVSTAFIKGKTGYDDFIKGAEKGVEICVRLIPTLVGLLVAVGLLRNSGFLDRFSELVSPIASYIHFPTALVPLAIIKMFSSAAATSLLLDIYKEFGTDSFNGYLASVMLSSTETIMYLMAMYYMSVNVKHTRYTLSGALIVTIAGIAASAIITNLIFTTGS